MLRKEERRCTDMMCCLIFAVFWVGMIIVGAVGLSLGDPKRLRTSPSI